MAQTDASEGHCGVLDDQAGFHACVAMQRRLPRRSLPSRMVRGPDADAVCRPGEAVQKSVPVYAKSHLSRLIYLDAATIKGVVGSIGFRARLRYAPANRDPEGRRRRAVALTERGRNVTEAAMVVACPI